MMKHEHFNNSETQKSIKNTNIHMTSMLNVRVLMVIPHVEEG